MTDLQRVLAYLVALAAIFVLAIALGRLMQSGDVDREPPPHRERHTMIDTGGGGR